MRATSPLKTHPCRRIGVPLVAVVRELPKRSENSIPAPTVRERSTKTLGDEGASVTATYPTVELADEALP